MIKIRTILFLAAISFLVVLPCLAQNDIPDDKMETFNGRVVSVDTGKPSIMVRGATDRTFLILPDTKIFNDTDEIKLSDINVGNYAVVGYYKDEAGIRKATTISVEYNQ